MSGHSKWNNIKNKKGAEDSKKAKIFGQLSKNIRLAVKTGGSGDPKFNPSLRLLLEKTREANMPREKVQKAIDAGLGKGGAATITEVIYEAFGPGGAGLMIVILTDNPNRTTPEIRNILHTHGGSLGAPHSVRYQFTRDDSGNWVPNMPFPVEDDDFGQLLSLATALHAHPDVEDVFCTVDLEEKEE